MEKLITDDALYHKIDEIIAMHGASKHNLLAILLEVQEINPNHYISKDEVIYISKKLDTHVSNVFNVMSFYSALSDKPKGRYVIQICNSTCCKVSKYEKLQEMIEKELKIKVGETTSDGMFSLEYSSCFGACDISPAIKIGHEVYGMLDQLKLKRIIESYRGN
ncbi:NADH-quinone oxidoreductase subunit NuoE family protein [Anaerovorax odorimutans]|uniref:NADH-quinone oxidoreductase subunit NuoE family protein n=1 Tax=Anaerovorax odorimutans TaxID=109327 RepID=UPI000402BC1C|nr:NAD(P)H-dependent oxidoreductase subunit E [Anaerovorax odorimutans]